jgi:multidrug efflux system membrane fusion protein
MTTEGSEKDNQGGLSSKIHTAFLYDDRRGFSVFQKITMIIALLLVIGLCIGLWRWFFHPAKKPHHAPLANVVLGTAKTADVPVYLNALGAVTSLDSVTVVPEVNGLMQKVFFKEGQLVKKNDLLAQIDDRPFRALLNQYEGELVRDIALLENARLDLIRYQTLWKEDSVSKQTLDTQSSLVKQLEGTVKSDQGLVDTARVNLTFCRIVSPIDGRIGLRLVDPGNFVQTTSTTGLFVINTLNPISVVFTLPEDNIPQFMKQLKVGKKLTAQAYDRSQNKLLAKGTLSAVDNQIDPTTGTVKLRALFKNADDSLFPNQFVNIKLLVDTIKNATIIPTPAIQNGTKTYVYKYDQQTQTVHVTPIVVGIADGDNTVVTSGILPGDSVVIEGTDKLTDAMKVSVSQQKQTPVPTAGTHLSEKQ